MLGKALFMLQTRINVKLAICNRPACWFNHNSIIAVTTIICIYWDRRSKNVLLQKSTLGAKFSGKYTSKKPP